MIYLAIIIGFIVLFFIIRECATERKEQGKIYSIPGESNMHVWKTDIYRWGSYSKTVYTVGGNYVWEDAHIQKSKFIRI